MINYYIVHSKGDDYGHCLTELVQTTAGRAKEYYHYQLVTKEDAQILQKYFTPVDKVEEFGRSTDERFYGVQG